MQLSARCCHVDRDVTGVVGRWEASSLTRARSCTAPQSASLMVITTRGTLVRGKAAILNSVHLSRFPPASSVSSTVCLVAAGNVLGCVVASRDSRVSSAEDSH